MSGVFLIARRELSSFFSTWMGYIIVFAALLIDGLLFNAFAITSEPKFSAEVLYQFFYFSSGVGMAASIFLGMRLLAEEKVSGTLVLFYTSPLSERQLIWGKFLSVVVFFLLLQVLSLYMPALILFQGKISWGHLFSGYLGTSLLGIAVLSVALFASTVSPNQLISGILGASLTVILLILWIMAAVVDEPFREIFSYLSIHNKHFTGFARGLVYPKDIIYYLSVTMFFLECSIRVIENRRVEG